MVLAFSKVGIHRGQMNRGQRTCGKSAAHDVNVRALAEQIVGDTRHLVVGR